MKTWDIVQPKDEWEIALANFYYELIGLRQLATTKIDVVQDDEDFDIEVYIEDDCDDLPVNERCLEHLEQYYDGLENARTEAWMEYSNE